MAIRKRKKRFHNILQAPVTRETYDLFETLAYARKMKKTDLIRQALDEYIENHADDLEAPGREL